MTLVRQVYRSISDVDLTGYSVGDEPGAVLAEKIDLSAGMADGGINVRISLVDVLNDGDLFLNGWQMDFGFEKFVVVKA